MMMVSRRRFNPKYIRTAIGLAVVMLYLFPVYWMVATSLKSPAEIFASPPKFIPWPLDFSSYQDAVIHNSVVHRAILSSIIIATGVMLLTLVLATPAAYALARFKLRGSGVMTLLLVLGQLLPAVVIAGPLFVLFRRLELTNSYQAMIIADVTATLPFAVIVLRPYFLTIPGELEQAAMLDGANRFRVFWEIVLPLVQPGLVTVAAFAFLMAWGEFIFALSLNLDEKIQPITVALNKFSGQYGTRWNDMMAVSTTVAIPIIIVFVALQRFIVSGISTGATKE
ncbi:MAG: carbohydrate ABC transporter permease [Thermomicrobiales bacterium]